jgi:hypothetical protein
MKRRWLFLVVLIVGLLGPTAGPAAAFPGFHPRSVTVDGAVTTPASYSTHALASLKQTTFSVTRHTWWGSHTEIDQGVSLEDLVNLAGPTLPPNTKNAMLRVTVTVGNPFGWHVTLALGELDQGFGNHPAYLALSEGGARLAVPELVVPGDATGFRSVPLVDRITVAVQNTSPTTPPAAGSLTIISRGVTRVLTAGQLASLPSHTLQVTFVAGTASQTHTEIGPTLQAVLRAARVRTDLNTWVAAVGSDGYVATVTPAEAWIGGRPLLVSLNEDGVPLSQPRLVVDGDVKGGRYVSGVVDLAVGHGALGP